MLVARVHYCSRNSAELQWQNMDGRSRARRRRQPKTGGGRRRNLVFGLSHPPTVTRSLLVVPPVSRLRLPILPHPFRSLPYSLSPTKLSPFRALSLSLSLSFSLSVSSPHSLLSLAIAPTAIHNRVVSLFPHP